MNPSDPRIVGLDLSPTSTGIAHVDGTTEIVKPKGHGFDRVNEILDAVTRAIGASPELVMIERPVIVASHINSARETIGLNEIVRWTLWNIGTPYLDVSPNTLKVYATGDGRAGKYAVLQAADHRLGYRGLCDDEADALWLRALGWGLLDIPLLALPLTHTRALATLRKARPIQAVVS